MAERIYRVNNRITAPQVRLIDADGTQVGLRPTAEALKLARSKNLDLVEIAPDAKPPVCKVLDFTKFKYDLDKKRKETKKKAKAGILKEIRLRPNIGEHDLDTKLRHALKFLKERDKVRFTVVFRGRQNAHKDLGRDLLMKVAEKLAEFATPEAAPRTDRNRMNMMMIPKG